MLNRTLRKCFSGAVGSKNPQKHFYMNQGTMTVSESWAWVGRIFTPKRLANKTASADIQLQVAKSMLKFAAEKTKNPQISTLNFQEIKDDSIGCLGMDLLDLDDLVALLKDLLNEVVVKEHRYRNNLEKMERAKIHRHILVPKSYLLDVLNYESMDSFVQKYSFLLETLADQSNNYTSKEILGAQGQQDESPEFILGAEDRQSVRQNSWAKNDLKRNIPENNTATNIFMRFLHE